MDIPARGFVTSTRATSWEESLVSGNGRIGALLHGGPAGEVVTFSHERLFLPATPPLPPIEMAAHLPRVRALLLAGDYQEAADLGMRLADEQGYAGFRWTDPFVPAFDLRLTTPVWGELRGYGRHADWATGEVGVNWQDDRGPATRELFVSRADNVAVLRLLGAGPGKLDCAVAIEATPGPRADGACFLAGVAECQAERCGHVLGYSAVFKQHHGGRGVRGYRAAARVVVEGGQVVPEDGGLNIEGADGAVVLVGLEVLTASASATFADLAARLNGLSGDYEELLLGHAALHGALFNQARLDLGGGALAWLPSEELIDRSRTGVVGAALLEKLFDAGRYAIISSSGDLPPNLQGVWTGTYQPPWSGDYTHNGNVQTALAAILSSGTPELLLGYFSYLRSMMDDFHDNSRALFGCRGVYVPSRLSTHGLQNHFNQTWCHEFWTAAAGWAARLFYDYWQYTGDDQFLAREALPFMEEVADFYEDFLVEDGAGRFMFIPSVSPENNPGNSASQATVNATMDIAVAKDSLRALITASTALGVNGDRISSWEALLARLPEYVVDEDGALAEWAWPALHNNQAHRHASHLYPLLYEVDPEILADERLLAACRRAVELRLQWRRDPGNGEMAFGVAWLGLAAAHLGMADAALEALSMLARYWRPSLVPAHDSLVTSKADEALFNVDICGGLPALIVEMLVQSSVGRVSVLPALPAQWESGCIEGIACRGQVEVLRLAWRPGSVQAVLRSAKEARVEVVFPVALKALRVDAEVVDDAGQLSRGKARLTLLPGIPTALEALLEDRRGVEMTDPGLSSERGAPSAVGKYGPAAGCLRSMGEECK
jgi:hypothetical protein